MYRYQCKATRIVNNQGNVTPVKETNKTLMADFKKMEIYEFSDEEFRIILLKKFHEPQENRQPNEISKAMHE